MSKASEGTSENTSELLKLARKKFGELNEAEEKLFCCFADGEIADCCDPSGEKNDPNGAQDWDPSTRVIRAECIIWLCTDRQASELATYRGIPVKGARIEGELDLSYARISFPLFFIKCAFSEGINLQYSESRNLYFDGTHTGPILGGGLKVEGHVFLREGFKAEGELSLVSAKIVGNLSFSGGHLINNGKKALNANGASIKGGVFLNDGFKAEGEVDLTGATISEEINCKGGQFINKGAIALTLNSVKVGGCIQQNDGFISKGEVVLIGAQIGENLQCNEGNFINKAAYAIRADSMKVKGHVFMNQGFKAEGTIQMGGMAIDGHFVWVDVNSPENVKLKLLYSSIGILWDDYNSWPVKENLFLEGLVYDGIYNTSPRDAKSRINWLRRQPEFHPQPYEQLAAVLRKGGQDEDARKVLIAKNKDKARLTKLTWSELLWYRVFGPIIGYGYRPWRAFWIGFVIVLLGWLFFWAGNEVKIMTPTKDSAYVSDTNSLKRDISPDYPKFSAPVYSLDVFVPLVDLHQSSYWLPNANRDGELPLGKDTIHISGKILRYYLWFEIIAGWILTSLLVVGLTGLVRT